MSMLLEQRLPRNWWLWRPRRLLSVIDVTMDGTALATDTATFWCCVITEHDAGNGGVMKSELFSNGAEVTYEMDSADALGATGWIMQDRMQ